MVDVNGLMLIDYVLVLITQAAASIQDVRTREISDWTWIIGSIICIPLGIYLAFIFDEVFIYIISVVFGIIVGLLAYWLRAMGGADSKSIMFISASIPPITLPSVALSIVNITSISVLINSLILSIIIYIPYNIIQNLRYGDKCEALSKLHGLSRALYMTMLMCVPAREIIKKPNNYSISQTLTTDGFEPLIKLGLDVEDPRERLVEWISQGKVNVNTPILVNYHIPMIVPITIGLLLYIITHLGLLTVLLGFV
ncbi:MAG: A24 family peptidase [Vulcanisaeta sp. AZ3]